MYRDEEERERYRLTAEGTRVREILTMADGQDAGILLEARRADRNPGRGATPKGRGHL